MPCPNRILPSCITRVHWYQVQRFPNAKLSVFIKTMIQVPVTDAPPRENGARNGAARDNVRLTALHRCQISIHLAATLVSYVVLRKFFPKRTVKGASNFPLDRLHQSDSRT